MGKQVNMRSRADRRGLVLCLVVVTTKLFVLSYAWAPRSLLAYAASRARTRKTGSQAAGALTPDPQVVLMGQPFAALDGLTRTQLYDDIQPIWQESCKTIVFVTYNVREAVCLDPRLVLLLREPGRVSQIFDIPLPHPRDINSPELASCASRLRQLLRAPQQRCPNTTPRFYAPPAPGCAVDGYARR